MDKEIIIKNFARYAHLYDKYADVQGMCGLRLLKGIKERHFRSALEIGCGTGNFTSLLRKNLSGAKIKAVDISERMIEIARSKLVNKDVEFVVADAEKICLDENFELLASNACFQWLNDLEGALIRFKEFISKGGTMLFSIFGPGTFCELNECLKNVFPDVSLTADNFLSKQKIEAILGRNFAKYNIQEIIRAETFIDLRDLLKKIKYTGIRGSGIGGKSLLFPKILEKLEKIYFKKFEEIKATYQIFICEARTQ